MGKVHRENPVLALYWPCTGLQCILVKSIPKSILISWHMFTICWMPTQIKSQSLWKRLSKATTALKVAQWYWSKITTVWHPRNSKVYTLLNSIAHCALSNHWQISIDKINNIARYNLIDTKFHQMVFRSARWRCSRALYGNQWSNKSEWWPP